MNKDCSIDGCNNNTVAFGLCDTHYRRFKRFGDANAGGELKGRIAKDHTGKRFGRWTVIERVQNAGSRTAWLCKCDCGTESRVATCHLVSGKSLSCGCYRDETTKNRATVHGYTDSSEYKTWCFIKSRVNNPRNPSYNDYGGRGIRICDSWNDFKAFYEDMGAKPSSLHSIGRIDNDGDYCPENCRWETPKQQANNTRRNKYIEIDGVKKTLTEICEERGLVYGTVKWRLRMGQPIEKALR